jgi:mono/diheme cytochrome c family protein
MCWAKRAVTLAQVHAFFCAVLMAGDVVAAEAIDQLGGPRGDYILNCGGCHGIHGISNATFVPSLKDLMGYYLRMPEGRAYLPRLPNVAFSTLNDARLAGVLNYVVFDMGGASAPPGSKPYGAAEVAKWRRQPLTEVVLSDYRRQMVETLIKEYQAPSALRLYGNH